jgi:hypothetical protein
MSLMNNDEINDKQISKTMKSLICSLCLIYDCEKHPFLFSISVIEVNKIVNLERI